MDLETLKNDCNELIDELEGLQATGNQLDNRILELQEQLRVLQEQTEPERIKLEWPESEKEEPELTGQEEKKENSSFRILKRNCLWKKGR